MAKLRLRIDLVVDSEDDVQELVDAFKAASKTGLVKKVVPNAAFTKYANKVMAQSLEDGE